MKKDNIVLENCFDVAIIGAQRSGKTYWTSKMINDYVKTRGTALAYNYGKEKDFPSTEYITIKPLSFNEHIQEFYRDKEERGYYKLNPKIEYFRCNNQIYHFKDFSKLFYKKKVRMSRIFNRNEETAFFNSIFLYVSRTLVVFDDCKPIFRFGLNDAHDQLFFRKNHSGALNSIPSLRNKGVDIITIWHNIDHVPSSLWDSINRVILFKFMRVPTFKKLDDEKTVKYFTELQEILKDSPKYTAIEMIIEGEGEFIPKEVTI